MITESEITVIGRTLKPHGITGEIAATIDTDVDPEELKCLILDMDGIFVPFFIESYRSRGSEAVLLTIAGIRNESEAAELCGKDIFALKSDIGEQDTNDEGFYMSDLIGYTLLNQDGKKAGVITGFDDSTVNTLLIIKDDNEQTKYVPVADELIKDFNEDKKEITLILPEGLLEL